MGSIGAADADLLSAPLHCASLRLSNLNLMNATLLSLYYVYSLGFAFTHLTIIILFLRLLFEVNLFVTYSTQHLAIDDLFRICAGVTIVDIIKLCIVLLSGDG